MSRYYIKRMMNKVIRQFFYFCKIKDNRIVLMNFAGRGYGDTPKYITEYLLKEDKGVDIVWLSNDDEKNFPDKVTVVQYGTLKAYYMLGTAKIWIDNVRYAKGIRKKKKQVYIQTWHGSFSQKKLEKEAEQFIGVAYIKQAKKDAQITDVMLSNSKLQSEDFKKNFWYKGKIIECGYPRNDFLLRESLNENLKLEIKKKLNIKDNWKIVLFAPTFRDSDDISNYILDFDKLVRTAKEHYGENVVLLVRLHPNVAGKASMIKYSDTIVNASMYPDMQELLLITDLLITDYSSSIFDFMLLERDILIYAADVEEYNRSRGLKSMFWELPFPRFEREDEMYSYIKNNNCLMDIERLNAFKEKYGAFDDGNGSQCVGDYILKVLKDG